MRRRMRAGIVASRKEPTPSGFRWLVEVPELESAGAHAGVPPLQTGMDAGAALAALRRERDALAADKTWLQEALERRDVELSELRRLLGNAQQLALRAPVQDGPVDAPGRDSDAVAQSDAVRMPRRRWRTFWRSGT
jgi:hypothetical protein